MPHGAAKRLFLEKGDGYRDSPLPASNSSDLWGALSSLRAVRDHKAAGAVAGSAAPVCGQHRQQRLFLWSRGCSTGQGMQGRVPLGGDRTQRGRR